MESCVLTKKNAILVLISIELMLNAANINFVAFAAYNNDASGYVFALFSIGIARQRSPWVWQYC